MEYTKLSASFPAISDIQFATLQIWWNLSNKLSIATLNNNLVINYQIPHDLNSSGIGLIGINQIDQSLKIIFDYQAEKNIEAKVIHVPEFVVKSIGDRSNFNITEELDYKEYILDAKSLSNPVGPIYRDFRYQVNRFVGKEVAGRSLAVGPLDLNGEKAKASLFNKILEWEQLRETKNDPDHTEHQAIAKTLNLYEQLELKNFSLFIDGELFGVILYHHPAGKNCYVLHHIKVNHNVRYSSDYLYHQIALEAQKYGIDYLNIEMDLGIEALRKHKLKLIPIMYFDKFTISPKLH